MSTPITFTIPGEEASAFKAKIQEVAYSQGLSLSEWIVDACAEKLRKEKS